MTDPQKKILEMLADKKISTDEAYRLLNAIRANTGETEGSFRTEASPKTKGKYLRVTVMPAENHENATKVDRVNVRIPMSLIRAGIKLTALIPPHAYDKINGALKEKGIDFDLRNIKTEDIEDLITALADMEVDVESGRGEKVKVFVE